MKNKIRILSIMSTLMFVFYGCTVQEKMNPMIFTDRFSTLMNNEITIDESFTESGRHIIFFSDKSGEEYVCEMLTDKSDNIKKICLASNSASKAESFEYIFEKVLKVYAPNEITSEIIPVLFKKKWNYHTSQWYRYAGVISDEGIFASIENLKLSTQSDAQMTLKQSDIIHP